MKPNNDVAIRKRTQIAKANRTMFLWIAGASAIIGATVVVSIFLGQKLMYNEKVLAAKQDTVRILEHNNSVVTELQDQVRALDADSALSTVKANEDDQAIQVILDALPSEANSLALGASLQNKLLAGIPGLSLDSLQIDPVVGVETLNGGESAPIVVTDGASNVITFRFSVTGNEKALKTMLAKLERSIRTIHINTVSVEISSVGVTMSVQAYAFYEPAKTIELREETVPR